MSGPLDTYRGASDEHRRTLERLDAEIRRVERGRLGTFLVSALVGVLYRDLPAPPAVSLAVSAGAALGFLALVVRHRRLARRRRRVAVAVGLARLGMLRLWRQWDEIAEEYRILGYRDPLLDPARQGDPNHPYQEDLDVFGPSSLRALLGPTPTPTGVATLRAWLSGPAPPEQVAQRQSAVRALAPDFAGRETLATEALTVDGVDERAWAGFRAWLSEPRLFGGVVPAVSVVVAHALPPVTIGLFVVYAVPGSTVAAWTWVLPLAIQGALAWRWGTAARGYLTRATDYARGLRRYQGLLRAWEDYPADEPTLSVRQARLHGSDGLRASAEILRLERWLDAADSRASMLYPLVAWVFLFDVHLARGLERWRARAGSRVEDWFEALGELEALAALATLAHDHPDWSFPDLRGGEPGIEAEELGHPLIADSVLKRSDVRVDGPGRFLLVTGSNMSGKSTLLRSLGLAAIMAQAGSVVCARRLSLTPLRTFSSMRVNDSLRDGVSLFMAELKRLKALVDAAQGAGADEPALLYLIDEVLQGTNSDERRIAARRIVAHLLDARAIGAVTTHDLSLHEDPRLEPAATKVHFREHVGGGGGAAVLTFDYKLRPGLATSRNALKLLEIVGLADSTLPRPGL